MTLYVIDRKDFPSFILTTNTATVQRIRREQPDVTVTELTVPDKPMMALDVRMG